MKLESNAIVMTSPLFVDEAGRDLHLAAGSPLINADVSATRTVGAGSSAVLPVEDVGYLYDGFGIPEETGDVIRLEDQSSTVRIVRIDYTNRTLTLDKSIT